MTKCPRLTKTMKVLGIAFPSGLLPTPSGRSLTTLGVAVAEYPLRNIILSTAWDFSCFGEMEDEEGIKDKLVRLLSWSNAHHVVINLPAIKNMKRELTDEEKESRQKCKALAANLTYWLKTVQKRLRIKRRVKKQSKKKNIIVQRTVYRDESIDAPSVAKSWDKVETERDRIVQMKMEARNRVSRWAEKRLAKEFARIESRIPPAQVDPSNLHPTPPTKVGLKQQRMKVLGIAFAPIVIPSPTFDPPVLMRTALVQFPLNPTLSPFSNTVDGTHTEKAIKNIEAILTYGRTNRVVINLPPLVGAGSNPTEEEKTAYSGCQTFIAKLIASLGSHVLQTEKTGDISPPDVAALWGKESSL